jgi:predicted GNAT family acetyltransferase
MVENNVEAGRFEIHQDGELAFLQYQRNTDSVVMVHTEVPKALAGRGLGSLLAKTALEWARAEGLRVVANCPFVREYIRKHPAP